MVVKPVQWEDDLEQPLDVWTFRATERLKVHEARTLADNESGVVRGSVRTTTRIVLRRLA